MHVRAGRAGIYYYSSDVSCTMFTCFCSCAHFHPPDNSSQIILQILPCCHISFRRSSGRSAAGWFGLLCFYVRLSQRMYGTLGKDIRLNRIVPSIFGLHCHRCDDVRYSLVSGRWSTGLLCLCLWCFYGVSFVFFWWFLSETIILPGSSGVPPWCSDLSVSILNIPVKVFDCSGSFLSLQFC